MECKLQRNFELMEKWSYFNLLYSNQQPQYQHNANRFYMRASNKIHNHMIVPLFDLRVYNLLEFNI